MKSRKMKAPIHPDRESKTLEFKSKVPDFNKLAKTCIAFANGSGGEIVIGVEDKTKSIVGVTEADRARIYDQFPGSLYDCASSDLVPHIFERTIEGKHVIVIKIWPGTRKPYFLRQEGSPHGVYVRVGSNTRRANEQSVEDLVREHRRVSFDEEPSGFPKKILSDSLLKAFYGANRSDRRMMADRVLTPSGHGSHSHTPTYGGILMFCEFPEKYVPEAFVVCTRFAGTKGRSIVQTDELHGPISVLAESVLDFVSQWLERDYQLHGIRKKGRIVIPPDALREAIVNALVHRKYTIPGPIKIALFDDRLEIFNPGCFPGLVSLANLGDGTTFLRNLVIARIARKMRIMEKLGIGIQLIFDACRQANLKKPIYNEEGDFVKITFPFGFAPAKRGMNENEIMAMARKTGMIRPKLLMERFDVSRSTVTRLLAKLVDSGKLAREGKGPGLIYRIS